MIWDNLDKLLPLLNLLIIPLLRSAWKTGRRIDTIEFNQRNLCEKLHMKYVEGKL